MNVNTTDQGDPVPESVLTLSKLALYRCQSHVTNLHALLYTCGDSTYHFDENLVESMRIIITGMELDLSYCSHNLEQLGHA